VRDVSENDNFSTRRRRKLKGGLFLNKKEANGIQFEQELKKIRVFFRIGFSWL
jgi:hypothetical protein